jgi:myo-inositol 2-dehydrogenase / D-chiro-inositol 1-dehydrogenase
MSGPARIGVVGTGVMGAGHARTITTAVPGARVAAVSDLLPDRATALAAELPDCRVIDDPRALITDDGVDAVVVASSDDTHETMVSACLAAGKPVLCEKPLAANAAACRRLVEQEAALGRRLITVGFMRRFDPAYLAMAARLRDGTLGRPLMVHCVHRNVSSATSFGSDMLLTSSLTHEIDVTRWLLGEEITSVTVHTPRSSGQAPAGLTDPQLVVLRTTSGVLVDVEVFVNARYGYDVRCELVGELGTTELGRPATVAPDWLVRFADAYRDELRSWVDTLPDVYPESGPGAWDGYVAGAVAEACVRSMRSGRPEPIVLARRPARRSGRLSTDTGEVGS